MSPSSQSISVDFFSYIKANCKNLLGPPFWDARYVCRVSVGWKPERLEQRFLVISKFRMFFLSGRSLSKLQLEASYHLLHFSALEASGVAEVTGILDGRKLYIRLVEGECESLELIRHFLGAVKHYFPDVDPRYLVTLRPDSLYADYVGLPHSRPDLPCHNFRRTYAALCDFHKCPYREEVVWDIEKIYATHDCRTLRLEDFDHLAIKDLVPIVHVLEFSAFFTGIKLDNKVPSIKFSSDLTDCSVEVLKRNQSLKELALANAGLKSDFLISLSHALCMNQALPLNSVVLKGNLFDDHKVVKEFGSSLAHLADGLTQLDLSACSLSSKAVNYLFAELKRHRATVNALQVLRLAQNQLKDELLDLWTFISDCSRLSVLDLSDTGASTEKLFGALSHKSLPSISTVCISGCSFAHKKTKDLSVPSSLKMFMAAAPSLRQLDLKNTQFPAEAVKCILLGLSMNQEAHDVTLDLSGGTVFDRGVVSVLETCLPTVSVISSLLLQDNHFGDDLSVILAAISRMPNLRVLDIGGNNFANTKPKLLSSVMMEIVKMINDEERCLEELYLSGCKLGADLSSILNALGICSRLKRLDISGNSIRDFGAKLLAKALQVNSSLEYLNIDRNHVTFLGYLDIGSALAFNYSLLEMPYPASDVLDAMAKERDRTESSVEELESVLRRNRQLRESPYASEPQIKHQERVLNSTVEEEIRRAVYTGERALSDHNLPAQEAQKIQALLLQTEKTKQIVSQLHLSCASNIFIDDLVNEWKENLESSMHDHFEQNVTSMLRCIQDTCQASHADNAANHSYRELCMTRSRMNLKPLLADFKEKLQLTYELANFSAISTLSERAVHELMTEMNGVTKELIDKARSDSISSLGSVEMKTSSSSDQTPKTKRKLRIFNRNSHSRPKSIVDGEVADSHSMLSDSCDIDSTGALTPASGRSFEGVMSSSMIEVGEDGLPSLEVPKLRHLGKNRPRRQKRFASSAMSKLVSTPEGDDWGRGVDKFFGNDESGNLSESDTPIGGSSLKRGSTGHSRNRSVDKKPLLPPPPSPPKHREKSPDLRSASHGSSESTPVPSTTPGVLSPITAKIPSFAVDSPNSAPPPAGQSAPLVAVPSSPRQHPPSRPPPVAGGVHLLPSQQHPSDPSSSSPSISTIPSAKPSGFAPSAPTNLLFSSSTDAAANKSEQQQKDLPPVPSVPVPSVPPGGDVNLVSKHDSIVFRDAPFRPRVGPGHSRVMDGGELTKVNNNNNNNNTFNNDAISDNIGDSEATYNAVYPLIDNSPISDPTPNDGNTKTGRMSGIAKTGSGSRLPELSAEEASLTDQIMSVLDQIANPESMTGGGDASIASDSEPDEPIVNRSGLSSGQSRHPGSGYGKGSSPIPPSVGHYNPSGSPSSSHRAPSYPPPCPPAPDPARPAGSDPPPVSHRLSNGHVPMGSTNGGMPPHGHSNYLEEPVPDPGGSFDAAHDSAVTLARQSGDNRAPERPKPPRPSAPPKSKGDADYVPKLRHKDGMKSATSEVADQASVRRSVLEMSRMFDHEKPGIPGTPTGAVPPALPAKPSVPPRKPRKPTPD